MATTTYEVTVREVPDEYAGVLNVRKLLALGVKSRVWRDRRGRMVRTVTVPPSYIDCGWEPTISAVLPEDQD